VTSHICGRNTIAILYGNTVVLCVLSGEDLSRYSNKIESVCLRNVRIIAILLRKWCHNNKHFAEVAPQNGGKTVGIDMIRRNYVTVTLCVIAVYSTHTQGFK